MVTVVSTVPHKSVVKEAICGGCGSTLNYVPNDVVEEIHRDYTGCGEMVRTIKCPVCSKQVTVR